MTDQNTEGSTLEQTENNIPTNGFAELKLNADILKGIENAGFLTPTSIQENIIPKLLEGKNVIGKAQTGSGKTASFVLPALNILKFERKVEVLVLVPTRELSQQAVDGFQSLGKFVKGLKVTNIVGGESHSKQIRDVKNGAQVVVATPGRLLDLLSSKRLPNFSPKLVVLDEADEMMDMGFIEDIQEIFTYIPAERQTALFSATMPPAILNLAKKEVPDAEIIKGKDSEKQNENIERNLYIVDGRDREDALIRILETEKPEKAIVFCRTRQETDDLCQSLNKQGILSRAIHGDLNQNARIHVMNQMKEGKLKIMVATDVASRGIDISDLSHVFNYHTPENQERFTHRIGRTGRAGNKGKAVTLATPRELRSHLFFKQYSLKKFNILPVPTLSEIKSNIADEILGKLDEINISKQAKKLYPKLSSDENSELVIQQLLTLVINNATSVSGPQSIGYDPDNLKDLLRERRSRNGGGHSRRRSGGSGARRGGGSDSSRRDFKGGRSRSGGGNRSSGASNSSGERRQQKG